MTILMEAHDPIFGQTTEATTGDSAVASAAGAP
jgi:hypothetical protein